jgi:molybdate transport system substrate-binding protein
MKYFSFAAAAVGATLLVAGAAARADELRVISSNGVKAAIEELAPKFEAATGHKLAITWGAANPLKAEIEKGASPDVAMLTADAIDDLVWQGKLTGATRAILADSNAGVAVRKGAAKPDIATVAGFRQALLDAKSIGFVERGATGAYIKVLLDKLGIAGAVRDKLRPLPVENPAANAVARGEAEIGITQISEILPYPGAELAGPLPKEIQLTTPFAAAVGAGTQKPDAAKALIAFVTSPAAAPVFKAKGLEPAR